MEQSVDRRESSRWWQLIVGQTDLVRFRSLNLRLSCLLYAPIMEILRGIARPEKFWSATSDSV